MAVGSNRPDPTEVRDPEAEGLKALKARIAEYEAEGRDTSFMQEQVTAITNRLKGRRSSEIGDRDDSTDGAAEMKKAEKARRSGSEPAASTAKSTAVTDGVQTPDDAPGAKSSVPDQVTNPAERVDGPQKTSSVPDQGPKREDADKTSAASKPAAESAKKSPSPAATKVASLGSNDKK